MTGVLDLMHAFSYAYRAAAVLDDPNTYRRQGLPLTSSHIESAIKQINARVKGTGKFWRNDHANAILQLRADTLSDSQPQKYFWTRWQTNQTEVNQYRTTAPETNNIPENAPLEDRQRLSTRSGQQWLLAEKDSGQDSLFWSLGSSRQRQDGETAQ